MPSSAGVKAVPVNAGGDRFVFRMPTNFARAHSSSVSNGSRPDIASFETLAE